MQDPYAVTWKRKLKEELVADIVGHIPKEILRAAWFFLEPAGKINGKVFEEKYRPSPIPKGGPEIMLNPHRKILIEKRENRTIFILRARNK